MFKKGAGTALDAVIADLAKKLLQQVVGIESPVGLEQFLK